MGREILEFLEEASLVLTDFEYNKVAILLNQGKLNSARVFIGDLLEDAETRLMLGGQDADVSGLTTLDDMLTDIVINEIDDVDGGRRERIIRTDQYEQSS